MIGGVIRRTTSPLFVGRREELQRLTDALDRAGQGEPSLILIAGDAGMGKTRLATEFTDRARAGGAQTLVGACLDVGEGAYPYAPVAEALRRLAHEAEADIRAEVLVASTPELGRLVPALAPAALPAMESTDVGADIRQAGLFDGVLGVLGALAAHRPVVLVLEDLQWADNSTRDLIRFLVRNIRSERLLLVATYRSDDLHRRHPLVPLLAELDRSDRVEGLDVRPFERNDLAEQLGGILGEPPPPSLVDAMFERSEGIPFYVEELLARAGGNTIGLPATLREILGLRMAGLSDTTLLVVRAAAAVGTQFSHDRLAAVVDLTDEGLTTALREAIDSQVIVSIRGSQVPTYAFRHALLRESAYDELLPSERVRLHARLADSLARLLEAPAADDPALVGDLAIHAYYAHDLVRAFEGSVRAMHALLAIPALPEALTHGERALELWAQVENPDQRAGMDQAALLVAVARIAANVGRLDQAVALGGQAVVELEAAVELGATRELDDGMMLSRLVTALDDVAHYAWEAGDIVDGMFASERAYALIADEAPSRLKASVLTTTGFIYWSEGRLQDGARLLREAMAVATTSEDRRAWAAAASSLSETLAVLGRPVSGAELADEAGAILTERSADAWDFYGAAGRAYAIWIVGRFEESARLARDGLEWAIRYGLDDRHGVYCRMGLMEALVELGRYEEVGELARPFLARSITTPAGVWILQAIARVAIAQGRFDDARRYLEREQAIRAPSVNESWQLEVEVDLARGEGRFDDARSLVDTALAATPAGEIDGTIWWCLALGIAAAADRVESAGLRRRQEVVNVAATAARRWLRHLEAIVKAARENGGAGPFWEAALTMAEAQGTSINRTPDASLWRLAVRSWDALPRPLYAAAARLGLARALLQIHGDRAEADEALQAAFDAAATMAAKPLLSEIETLARQARLDLGPKPAERNNSDHLAALTGREREALRLVAAGHTNREIANRLFISEKTASVHVSNAMAKLEALSRYEAAATAERLGLLD